jgi:Flp pilus assembly protein CpaB
MVFAASALRRASSRFTLAHGLMVLAALAAFTSTRAVLDQRGERIDVLVAAEDLERGQRVDGIGPALRAVSVPAGLVVQPSLVRPAELGAGVLVRSVRAGEPLLTSDLIDTPTARTMSLAIDRRVTVGLGLAVGDAVDVIGLDAEDRPTVVVEGLRVARLAQASVPVGLTVSSAAEFVTVEVDRHQALALVDAMGRDGLELLRSTGSGSGEGS